MKSHQYLSHLILLLIHLLLSGHLLFSQVIDLNDGLLAHYPLNGDVIDYSGNEFHGVHYNTTFVEDEDGNPNSAISFNGTSSFVDISLLADSFLANYNELTVSFKIKFNSINQYQEIFSLGEYGENISTNVFEIEVENGVFQLETETGEKATNWEYIMDILPEIDQWMCISVVCDNGVISFFKNGILMNEMGYVQPQSNCTGLYLGAFSPFSSNDCCYLNGILDEVVVHGRALDSNDLTKLCQFGVDLRINDENLTQHDIISIYPNPVNDVLRIESKFGSNAVITIFSIEGNLIEKTKYTTDLDISNLKNGKYFLRIKDGRENAQISFIKSR